jgi:hypothetical protein
MTPTYLIIHLVTFFPLWLGLWALTGSFLLGVVVGAAVSITGQMIAWRIYWGKWFFR